MLNKEFVDNAPSSLYLDNGIGNNMINSPPFILPGRYVRIVLKNVPVEFVTDFANNNIENTKNKESGLLSALINSSITPSYSHLPLVLGEVPLSESFFFETYIFFLH
jgi:hypothetical protein